MKKPILIVSAVFTLFAANAGKAENAGFTRLTVADPISGQMQVSVWYPTAEAATDMRLGPFRFRAKRDAPPLAVASGLVVMSHGTAGSDLGHRNVAVALAEAGFVVAAPLHPRDNFRDSSGVGTPSVMAGRPLQISAVIDAVMLSDDRFGRVPNDRIGAFGFSLGGYTVLALLGAQPDLTRIAAYCGASPDDPLCSEITGMDDQDIRRANDDMASFGSLDEPRLCAAVIVDPMAIPFSDDELVGIETRFIQLWRPELENALLAEANALRVARQLDQSGGERELQSIMAPGAHHYSFLDVFPAELVGAVPKRLTWDQEGFDRAEFQKEFSARVTDFLTSRLGQC